MARNDDRKRILAVRESDRPDRLCVSNSFRNFSVGCGCSVGDLSKFTPDRALEISTRHAQRDIELISFTSKILGELLSDRVERSFAGYPIRLDFQRPLLLTHANIRQIILLHCQEQGPDGAFDLGIKNLGHHNTSVLHIVVNFNRTATRGLSFQFHQRCVSFDVLQSLFDAGATPEKINRIASYTGVMAQSNMDQPNIGSGDRQTAVLLGKRVAEATARWIPPTQ